MPTDNEHSEPLRPFLTWQKIIDWAQINYRQRFFSKDELIPVRPGILYLVEKGAVRIVGTNQNQLEISKAPLEKTAKPNEIQEDIEQSEELEETFLGFVSAGHPFEIVQHPPFNLEVYAHVDNTTIIWMYWHDLDHWPHFRREVFEAFRYQHQRKLLWLSILGQKRAIDRLLGFLNLLVEEYGEPTAHGYRLPFPITHAQIGSALGATRVTVTRLMGKLRQRGLVVTQGDLIHLPKPGKVVTRKAKKAQKEENKEQF
jgi:CRP-like cAMP-binding protein